MKDTELKSLPFPVGARLGGGAFAEVFAVDTKKAVLKVALDERRSGDSLTGAAFFAKGVQFATGSSSEWRPSPSAVLAKEAAVLKGISQPAFVKVIDQGVIAATKRQWVLFERIEGVTWREAMAGDKPPGLAEVRQLVTALAEAQTSKQLAWHGDLKPENLLLTPKRVVRIIDPTSGCVEKDAAGQVGSMLTTDWYNPAFETSDLPSLGLVLIEVLTGSNCLLSASPEVANSTRVLGPKLKAWLNAARVTGRASRVLQRLATMALPRELLPSMPAAVEAVALKCLSLANTPTGLEMTEPYGSMAALAAALKPLT